MKINIISDLHINKQKYHNKFIPSDLLIIGGDTCPVTSTDTLIEFLDSIPKTQKTIFLLGNHEYLYYPVNNVITKFKEIMQAYPHIQVMENETVTLGNVRIICATLWSDFLGNGANHYQSNKEFIRKGFNLKKDCYYECHLGIKEPVSPDTIESWCNTSKEFIEAELKKNFQGKTIVVTHFAPSLKSIEEAYKTQNLTAFWVNSLDYLFYFKPDYWIHGHVHESKDYLSDSGTRVIANPRGNKLKTFNHTFDADFCLNL